MRISLARAAQVLFDFGRPAAPAAELGSPTTARREGGYGMFDYALRPFERNGAQLDYPQAPTRYGTERPALI